MDRAPAIFISLLLTVSLFMPFGVMAQENGEEPIVELLETTSSVCSISGLEVAELDYQQATAIQGIVTQDVATSAEEYRKQAALAELGVDTRTDRAKLADQYNFYFMGVDGTVFYYEVLDDLMKPDNGYLIGTEITGRIEYGGHLRENLAMCGKSPASVTTNVCAEKGDVDKRESYLKEVAKAQTKADILSFFVSLEGIGELAPSDVLNLGQSRLRMTEFTTSMATSGHGTSIFVLPQALVMYTAAMKKLDMIDLVVGIVGAGASMRSAKNIDPNQRGVFRRFKDFIRGKSTRTVVDDSLLIDGARGLKSNTDEIIVSIKNVDPQDAKSMLRGGDELIDFGDNGVRQMDALATSFDERATRELVDQAIDNPAEFRNVLSSDQLRILAGENIKPGEVINNKELITALKNANPEDVSEDYLNLLLKKQNAEAASSKFNSFKDLGRNMKTGDAQYHSLASKELDEFMAGKSEIGTKYYQGIDGHWDEITPEQYLKLQTGEHVPPLRFVRAKEVASPEKLGSMADEVLKQQDQAFRLGDTITNSRVTKGFSRMKKRFDDAEGIFKKVGAAMFPDMKIAGRGAVVGAARTIANRLALAIYTSLGTKAVMIARGLHALNDLMFRQGFLELTGSGLTLHYSKDEVGSIYADDSVIVLLAQNSLVKGLLSSYLGGELGAMFFGLLGKVNDNIEPIVSKANLLGDVLIFGGIMYPPSGGVVEVVSENPKGTTHIEQKGDHYIMHIREWDDHVYSAVEDVRTMDRRSKEGTLVTAMGLWTNKIDLYGHMYSEDDLPTGLFTSADTFIKKIGSWGVFSNLLIASSAYSVFFTRGAMGGLGLGASIIGAPLGLFLTSRGMLLAGDEFMTAQYTDMEGLAECIRGETEEPPLEGGFEGGGPLEGAAERVGEATGLGAGTELSCEERKPCATVLSRCLNQEGTGSAGMVGTAVTDVMIASAPGLGPYGAAIVLADVALSIYKIKLREECLSALATCQEHTFTIVGAAQYTDPVVIAEQQQSEQLKALPGLDALPINDFLAASGLQNVTNPLEEFSQQQLNVHTEGYNASGRIALDEVYYTHLQDVSIQWLEGNLPINLCSLDDEGDPEEANCLRIHGDNIEIGGRTIVSDELVPFKWMDTELPALIIPNTAVVMNLPGPDCPLFTVDKTGTRLTLNDDVINIFESKGFDEVERMMGTMRVINTDGGSIYPSVDYNGDFRLEHDKPDGSFAFSEKDVTVSANANVRFEAETMGFESAIFTGGSIVKKGNKIYILPKYFLPEMTGKQWLQMTKGTPFVSDTGAPLEALDAFGEVMGIDATATRIPGAEKLGVLTRLDAEKDINGDGVIQDEEKSGWRFYTDAETNETKFELFYNGEKEIYDADQIEIDEETGNIKVYEKDQPHVEANLLRDIETKVDSLGRTLLTIRDGEGNTLLEEALVTYLKGTGGAIRYDPDNNNYIFVNGQPVELNNDFKLNGFNPITGRTDPPLLQPSAVRSEVKEYEPDITEPPAVPLHDEGFGLLIYILAIFAGIYILYRKT